MADEDEGEEDTSVNGRIPREARKDGRRDEGGVGKTSLLPKLILLSSGLSLSSLSKLCVPASKLDMN